MRNRIILIAIFVLAQLLMPSLSTFSSADSPASYEAYVVQEKQTIASIAAEYGMSAEQLSQYNDMRPGESLYPGKILNVPIFNSSTVNTPPATNVVKTPDVSLPIKKNNGTLPGNLPPPGSAQTTGKIGKVVAPSAEIRTQPNGGQIIYDRTPKGTELLVIDQTATHFAVLMANGSTGWVERFAVNLTDISMTVDTSTLKSTPVARQDIIDTAMEYLGTPYKYGGALPGNVDCSLLVQTVFSRRGQSLPRTAAQQYLVGTPINSADLIAGDRLYFYDRDSTRIGHTGIYIGNDRYIHASSSRGYVVVDDFTSPATQKRYAGARR